jgi:hypothetical protein
VNGYSSTERRIALELLSTADAPRDCAITVKHLDRAGHPCVENTPDAVEVRIHAEQVAAALVAIATRLATSPFAVEARNS